MSDNAIKLEFRTRASFKMRFDLAILCALAAGYELEYSHCTCEYLAISKNKEEAAENESTRQFLVP
jgi:hypothetical protein